MSNTSNSQPWYQKDPGKGMNDRIAEISKMRDPGTFADEILMGGRFLFVLSLLFTGALCFFSYQFFLERFLSPEASFAAAAAITVLIEYGKKRVGMSALRMPFMQGWRAIISTPESTGVFVGAAAFAVVIFSVSVYNSTNGAARYAEQTANKKTETAFKPQTQEIDQQIAQLQRSVNEAPTGKWKGTVYYQDKKAVRAAQESIKTLTEAKATQVQQQRADFERMRGQNDEANAHSGTIALRIGGWLELMQILLMLLMASCERVLDRRNPAGATSTPPQKNQGIGFQRNNVVVANNGVNNPPQPPHNGSSQPIGFKRYEPETVTQFTQQMEGSKTERGLLTGKEADDAIKYHLYRLQREPSNLLRGDAKTETVLTRIAGVLDDMKRTLNGVEWCSEEVAKKVEGYWNTTALTAINDSGYHIDASEVMGLLVKRARRADKNA